MKVTEIIASKIEKLQINEPDKFMNYIEGCVNESTNKLINEKSVPFIIISTCPCGCGKIDWQINDQICSKKNAIDLFAEISKAIESQIAKQN